MVAPMGNGALSHARFEAIILTGILQSKSSVLSLSLVDLSRTNLPNKLLRGLTNILLINRPALAEHTCSCDFQEHVRLRSEEPKPAPALYAGKRAYPPKQLPPLF